MFSARLMDQFAEAFAWKAALLKLGDGLVGPTGQGPLINTAAVDKVERHVGCALCGGAGIGNEATARRSHRTSCRHLPQSQPASLNPVRSF